MGPHRIGGTMTETRTSNDTADFLMLFFQMILASAVTVGILGGIIITGIIGLIVLIIAGITAVIL